MKAAVYSRYGTEAQLTVEELPIPQPKADEVLLRVHATSINGSDTEALRGSPAYARMNGWFRPGKRILGSDISGTIATVGAGVTEFREGDSVFCDNLAGQGGFAEYVCVPRAKLVRKPTALTDVQAAAIPQSGVIAGQALAYRRPVSAGQSVLINGAAGGVGSFAAQMAKAAGAQVVGIDHGQKLSFLQSLGVEEAYDYRNLDCQALAGRFDKVIDLVGGQSVRDVCRMLKPNGHSLVVGGPVRYLLATLMMGPLLTLGREQSMSILAHQQSEREMLNVARMVEVGQIQSPVSAVFALDEIQQAFKAIRTNSVAGKVVITP